MTKRSNTMRYHIIIVLAALLLSGTVMANPVTTSDARQKADAFLKKEAITASGSRRAALQSPQLVEAPAAFGDALHVFNIEGQNGYVIVSGDDRTEEILGYVDNGSFDINNIPANMRFWLQAVSDAITTGQAAPKIRRAERAAVEPVVTTHWDQPDPFNNYILDDMPDQDKYYHDQLMTGCVATSMAQAVFRAAQNYKEKHGQWPDIATNTVPSYTQSTSGLTSTGWTFPELPAYTFDWANMREDNYSTLKYTDITAAQIKAVGKLMQYCGRSMKMEYDKINSGCVFVWAGRHMHEQLNLSKFCQSVDRAYYTSQDWEDMMYKEVSEGRAVCYSSNVGSSTSSEGHAYILDGYKDGLFHINWGWGKSVTDTGGNPTADGYFDLSVLQPMAAGSGSASVLEAQYKYLQQAMIHISYDDPEDAVSALNFYWNGKSVYTSYISGWGTYNVLSGTITYEEGWAIRNADGTISDNIWNKTTEHEYASIATNAGTTSYFSDMAIPAEDGDYDIVHISREKGTSEWHASYGTDKNYVTVTKSGGSITKAVAHPVDPSKAQFQLAGIDFIGNMEANQDNTVRVTVNNTGDDFFGSLAMYYSTTTSLSSTQKYEQLATLKPGETTHEFTVKLAKGEYNLWFIANGASAYASNAFGTGKMFIGYGEDANKVQAGNMQFDGQSGSTLSVKSVNGQLAEVTGTFDVTNNTGHSYSATYYANVEYGSGSSKTVYATAEIPFTVETGTHSVPFNLGVVTGLASGNTYRIRLYNKLGGNETDIATADFTLQPYFRYWLADGTVKEFAETSYYNQLSGDGLEAVAIDCRGISKSATMYMGGVTNKNCLFYIEESQKPTSSSYSTYGRNLVVDGVAENMVVNGDYLFYAPEAFTAEQISYKRTFTVGNTGNGDGWQTIMLPFSVNNVKCNGKNKRWFTSATDTRCHFWLMELTDATDEALTFDYATTFEAGKPYIIAVPGKNTEKWADSWDLTNKEMSFNGLNVTVPVTTIEPQVAGVVTFQGAYTAQNVDGYVLNAAGTKFEQQTGVEVKGYQAYITKGGSSRSLNITIAGQGTTGIGIVDNSREATTNDCYYDLQGRRVQQPANGLYIRNGKKILVK